MFQVAGCRLQVAGYEKLNSIAESCCQNGLLVLYATNPNTRVHDWRNCSAW